MDNHNQAGYMLLLRGTPFLLNLLLLLPLFSPSVTAQPFQKIYTSPLSQLLVAQDLFTDAAGECYLTGEWWRERPKTFLLKTTPDGLPMWGRAFSPEDADALFPMGLSTCATSDNGIVVSALKEKNGIAEGGALFKVSDAGNLEWAKFAPCVWRTNKVCADGGYVYYAAAGKGTRKVYLSKITNDGQVLWERLLKVGEMDLYYVESFIKTGNGDIILALKVAQFFAGGVGPEHTVLFRLDAAGTVKKVAYFPLTYISALVPLSDGRIAFRCSAGDVTWTGFGVMDTDFNWLWFKKSRLASMIFLPNIWNREAAKSGAETRLFALFYTPGGEKIALTFDAGGQLLDEQVYFSASYPEKVVTVGTNGYIRASGIRADAFMVTKMDENGTAPGCFFSQPCGLILEDGFIAASTIDWAIESTVCLETSSAKLEDMPVQADDFCFEPGPLNATFQLSDTVICAGETIDAQRNAGNSDIPFGLSEWRFQGGIPATANSPAVKNIRFNQPGIYVLTHVFNVAGCKDKAFATITVLPPPEAPLGADTTLCDGDTIHLQAGTNLFHTYRWNTGDTTSLLAAHSPGAYSVTITNAGGCTTSGNISLSFLSAQTVRLGNDTILCHGTSARIQSTGIVPGIEFHWNTGGTKAYLDVAESGTYIMTASTGGCAFSDTLFVEMEECAGCQVYVPTAFAPDRGAPNDVFHLSLGCTSSSVHIQMYDRWGNLVYTADENSQGWDGTFKGKRLPAGVYVYFAEIGFEANGKPGEMRKMSGSVTLIR